MVLNIFPRKKESTGPAELAIPAELPEPSPEALEEAPKRPARRGSRGGRGRGRTTDTRTVVETPQVEPAEVTGDGLADANSAIPASPRLRARRGGRKPAEQPEDEESGTPEPETVEKAPRNRRGSRASAEPATAREEPRPARPEPRGLRREEPADAGSASILRAIDLQNRQIERLIQLQEDMARRVGAGATVAAPPARVGVFVDAANVELASDRLRARFDWAKILRMLTENRQLVRATAYSPVHDDPGVSMETQRFVEPFLDKGYKVVTKPLKRFQDGTIKANVDIELALDIITMLDRLDVVCLVSGDGDFQRLVEVVQSRGVRVEVVAVGTSTAGNLRNAADQFIDLQARLRDVRL